MNKFKNKKYPALNWFFFILFQEIRVKSSSPFIKLSPDGRFPYSLNLILLDSGISPEKTKSCLVQSPALTLSRTLGLSSAGSTLSISSNCRGNGVVGGVRLSASFQSPPLE